MTIRDSGLLFDISTRLALLIENVKIGQVVEFNSVLREADVELRKLLSNVNYPTLDGLSKIQLNRLLLSLRRSQLRIYTAYTERLIKALQVFMRVRLDVTAVAFASLKVAFDKQPQGEIEHIDQLTEDNAFAFLIAQNEKEAFAALFGLAAIAKGSESLWGTIRNAPIPANGLYIVPFIQAFAKSATASVENTVRKGYANRQSVAEIIAEINGTRLAQGNSTQFAKILSQAAAVIDTAFAHVDQISSAAVISAIFARYQWVSVLDGNTTRFCRDHDARVFRYGQGPLPPAHYRCRSITIPLSSVFTNFDTPTLYAWLKRQPPEVQNEFLGKENGQLLREGKINAKNFVVNARPLQINQLKSKLGLILST